MPFEYKTEMFKNYGAASKADLAETLNRYAKDRWRLKQILPTKDQYCFWVIMEREKA